jgi:hypothetical protein
VTKITMLLAVALACIQATPAFGCINGVLLAGEEAEREVARVERMLRAGHYRQVIDWAEENEVSGYLLRRRVNLLELTARIRLKARERIAVRNGLPDLVYELEQLRTRSGDDPFVLARLAEALVLVPSSVEEARTLIEQLIKRDLMPDAEAWATGAFARRLSGDEVGSRAALRRCRQIAGRRRHACDLPLA